MEFTEEEVKKVFAADYPKTAKKEIKVTIQKNLIPENDDDEYYYTVFVLNKGKWEEVAYYQHGSIRQKLKALSKVYGYCRISRPQQSIERQIRNIKAAFPGAVIVQEAFTGTKMDRPAWSKLFDKVKQGETIVFDSVSRMSRNAEEGVRTYFELFERGVSLVFLKEHYIDTEVYAVNLRDKIKLTGTDEDEIFKGLNNYFRKLAERQIRIAFDQAEKEVQDLHQRTKEGIETARLNGKQIGRPGGKTYITKKELAAKEIIKKHSKSFGGSLDDKEVIKLCGVDRSTYYRYKQKIKGELENDD